MTFEIEWKLRKGDEADGREREEKEYMATAAHWRKLDNKIKQLFVFTLASCSRKHALAQAHTHTHSLTISVGVNLSFAQNVRPHADDGTTR